MAVSSDSPAAAIRAFDIKSDLDAVKRIWREVGWVEEDHEIKQLDHFFACGSTLVGTLDDVAECSVHITDGVIQLADTPLPLCAVTAVTTSRIARGHAFARRLTARQLAQGAAQGAAVAALGMFDQGFYDQLGFGTGAYDHEFVFDPGTLKVSQKPPTPRRLEIENYEEMHAAMLNRHKVNGSVCLNPPILMKAELGFSDKGFGLGYNTDGRLSHFIWLEVKGEHGPYEVRWMAYEDMSQLLELLALLKSLSDQVYSLRMMEPPEIQLQSLLQRPLRNRTISEQSKHAAEHESLAWWQLRVLDVPACVEAAGGLAAEADFQLNLSDPLDELLAQEDADGWRGAGGQYVVHLGDHSHAVAGADAGLPQLSCSVNAFTRLLWAVAPAGSLAVTDGLQAPTELLDRLNRALTFQPPHPGWDF